MGENRNLAKNHTILKWMCWGECVWVCLSVRHIYIMHLCVCMSVCVCVSFFSENLKSNIYLMHKQMKHALRFVYGDMKNASSFLHKWKWTCNWITRVQRGWKGKYTCMHVAGFEFRAVVEFGFWGHKTRHRRSRLAFGILNKHILGTKKMGVETIRTKNILQLAT